jgi:PadR family transcriptional regulator, regulatory protein PadR
METSMAENASSLMAGIPELVVLRLLAEREMYGYEIARAIKALTRDALSIGEGVLYPALHAMEARGLVRPRSRLAEGRMRIYYSLTSRGRTRLARLTERWRRMSRGVESILGSAVYG